MADVDSVDGDSGLVTTCVALSFNGRTSDSDSLDRGSNPWGATNTARQRTSLKVQGILDGGALCLLVLWTGTKLWLWGYQFDGKQKGYEL